MKTNTITTSYRPSRRLFLLLLIMIAWFPGFSQNVGINASGAAPNSAAGLDVDFADKGVLIPRVALVGTASYAPLSAHVAGMLIYNTATTGDVAPGFYYNNGTKWIAGFPGGNAVGNMLYWNGTAWIIIPTGLPGQYLQLNSSGVPAWAGSAFASITTSPATSVTATTASSGGTILSDGGLAVLAKGVCWSTTSGPTTANSTTSNGTGNAAYVSSLTGLIAGTVYYVRAYSTNNAVVSYGNEITFSTLPTVATTSATLITATSVRTGGTVTTGNATVIERGVCFATTANPTTANNKLIDVAPGSGAFISDLTGLTENTLYYVRAYAINAGGTAYGSQITFTTLSTLTTAAISAITPNSAASGGTIAPGGGQTITSRGICWSTSTGPTIALSTKTVNGSGTGSFTSNMTGLTGNTTYFVRAYATNAGGTAYGNELTFTTLAPIPATLTTTAIGNIGVTSATSGGTITDDGGAAITAKGVCWSTSPSPTIALSTKTVDGTGTGAFGSTMTPLTSNTLYYVRSYATNSAGTAYGNELTFTTCTTPIHNIGDAFGGGIVFYVDCSGQHGLIAATVDQGSAAWGCSGTLIGTSPNLGTGSANTTSILAGCSTRPIAASLARNYTGGGFNDWYLPSNAEMILLMGKASLVGMPAYTTYVTSSEGSATVVGAYYWYTGNIVSTAAMKTYGAAVRAIRSF